MQGCCQFFSESKNLEEIGYTLTIRAHILIVENCGDSGQPIGLEPIKLLYDRYPFEDRFAVRRTIERKNAKKTAQPMTYAAKTLSRFFIGPPLPALKDRHHAAVVRARSARRLEKRRKCA